MIDGTKMTPDSRRQVQPLRAPRFLAASQTLPQSLSSGNCTCTPTFMYCRTFPPFTQALHNLHSTERATDGCGRPRPVEKALTSFGVLQSCFIATSTRVALASWIIKHHFSRRSTENFLWTSASFTVGGRIVSMSISASAICITIFGPVNKQFTSSSDRLRVSGSESR